MYPSTEIQLKPRKDNITTVCGYAPDRFRDLKVCTDWPDLCHVTQELEVLTDIVSYHGSGPIQTV